MNSINHNKTVSTIHRTLRLGVIATATAGMCLFQTGCALLPSCEEYSWFQDRVQDCVDRDVSCFTNTYYEAQLTDTVQLAKNNLLYKYNLNAPPAYEGDNYHSCKVDLTVDGNSGKMISGSWNGDCDHWSRCVRYE